MKRSGALLLAAAAIALTQGIYAQVPANRPLRIIAFGAHPDDAELKFAGTAALLAARGHKVKLVALTNGDVGHFAQAGGPLAQRRKAEVEACHKKLGVETDVLDIHDGELMADLETRRKVVNLIRDWQADIVLSHRPWDYHPDHRAVGNLANDAAVIVAAPFFAPYTPPTKQNPIFLYYSDPFLKPYPFDPIVAVGFDDVADKKWDCISSLPSQFGDADSWQARYRADVPKEEAARKAFLIDGVKQRSADVATQYRSLLVKLYGEQKGKAIRYAEAFELNQYGTAATADDLKKMLIGDTPMLRPSGDPFAKRVVTTGLADPFQIAWGPDNYLWVTERTGGRITRVDPSSGTKKVAIAIDGVLTDGPSGVLGMALDPGLLKGTGSDFVYVTYSYDADPDPKALSRRTRIVRFTYDRNTGTLGNAKDILTNLPAGTDHQGGRLLFGPDRKLYFSIGDLGANQLANFCKPDRSQTIPTAAQVQARDWSLYEGKILRINLDGSVPADNPIIAGVRSHVYSYGHRNPQGLVFGPDGKLYESEHGPNTDDEINRIQGGKNYGWPYVAGYNDDQSYAYANWSASKPEPCESLKFTAFPQVAPSVPMQKESAWSHPDFAPPLRTFRTVPTGYNFKDPKCADRELYYQCWPTIGPSGLSVYSVSNGIPGWGRSLLLPSLKHGTIFRIPLNADGTAVASDPEDHEHFKTVNRYRDVLVSPDGLALFVATDVGGNTQDESGRPAVKVENPGSILEFRYHVRPTSDQ